MGLSNYVLLDKLSDGSYATVYKAFHKENSDCLLVLKLLKAITLSEYKQNWFEQKIEQLKVLNDPLLITPLKFTQKDHICFVTQYFYDGVPLDRLLQSSAPLSTKDFFTIACSLARALDKVHHAGIIHGGIKPHNILVNSATLDVRLIDFISTVDVRDVSHFIYEPSFIRETLCYTTPEQTGRINHRISFSSDMYSLGIVFYELLTGRIPFRSHDPLEIIHSHLAQEAPQVHTVNPIVPLMLSRIIAKLMAKEPEKRYQSSNALLLDLLRCRDEFALNGTIDEFPMESQIHPHRVTFISKMVGRERESRLILAEYEQVTAGEFRSLLISGLSGIGKTRLIQELQKSIVRHRGYFTSGKFDLYQKNIPYSSLIQAFRNLIRTFLTESDEQLAIWKKRILNAVGHNGQVLTDVVPELTLLIGPQPDVPQLPPVESLNRFHDIFERFLTCLASDEHPLVLFIDDLQWCDVASFDFLANIFDHHREHPYLFLLGAYRQNEVDQGHPLSRLINNIREQHGPLQEITLTPLQPEDCHEMVAYILASPLEQTRVLADFIATLSEGNPLFISESLSYLHNAELLFLDQEQQWRWDMEKIRVSDMPTTVVQLFGSKIRQLPPDLIELLEQCACMGNSFSPVELSSIRKINLTETFRMLQPALRQGLLIEQKNQLQFIHDKVQEAVLANIPAERRRRIHRQAGEHLLAAAPPGANLEKLDQLFTIVSHLNLGREAVPSLPTAYLLAEVNYHAGNKALDSLATEAANTYFRLSRELLPDDCWENERYDRTFRIFQKGAKTELMCGNYGSSEKLLSTLLDHAKSDLDKAECLAEQTTSLSSVGNFIKAIATANRGLAYFHKAIPDNPDEADRKRSDLMAEIAAHPADVWQTILNIPFTTERRSKIELAFYSELIPDLYMSGLVPQLYLAAAQSTRHCLAGGMDESVIYSFSIMGLQLGEQEDFNQAFRYEDLARDLSAKYPNTFGATRGMNGIVWCNMHSRSHPAQIVEYALKAIQCGKNCGDLYNAALSYGPLMWNLQLQGANFPAIEEYASECLHFSQRYHLSFSIGLAEAVQAGWIAPMKNGYLPVTMDKKLEQWQQENHIASAGSYCVLLGISHYYLGEYQQAGEQFENVRRYLAGLTDNVLKRQWYLFQVLNLIRLYQGVGGDRDETVLMARIAPLMAKIETWAALGPLLQPYLALIRAELARIRGGFEHARSFYLDAINIAHQQCYTFLEGHLNECLTGLLFHEGHGTARVYAAEANRLYQQCGAQRKQSRLTESYPDFFQPERTVRSPIETEPPSQLANLDVNYLMKSSHAISAEIVPEALLNRIMNVVIESSGAQHGYLLITDNGSLSVRAESHVSERLVVQTVERKLDDVVDIGVAIIRYVHRTGERIILENACQEGMFKDDAQIRKLGLRSVLCLPIIKQARMIGVLYLENRLFKGVFTSQKAEMTQHLTLQAAISLENALLVEGIKRAKEELHRTNDELEQRVAQRTADLEEQSRLLESFFKHTKTCFVFLDTEFNFIRVNEAYATACQRDAEEFPGQNHFDLYPSQELKAQFQQVVASKEPLYILERPFSFPDHPEWGTSYWDLVLAPMLNAQQQIDCLVFTLNNVTERKQTVDELCEKERLLLHQSRLAAMGEMINNIAHQWRQPLNILGMQIQQMRMFYELGRFDQGYLDSSVNKSMGLIQHMSQTIDDFRNFFMTDKEMVTFKLAEVINRTQSLVESGFNNQHIIIEITLQGDPTICGYPNELSQVLLNIMMNAKDVLLEKSIAEPRITICAFREADSAVVTISDNGGGIPPEIMGKIFDPYFTTKGPDKGTGVGLFMSKTIIEKNMGGFLTARNTAVGAEFRIELS